MPWPLRPTPPNVNQPTRRRPTEWQRRCCSRYPASRARKTRSPTARRSPGLTRWPARWRRYATTAPVEPARCPALCAGLTSPASVRTWPLSWLLAGGPDVGTTNVLVGSASDAGFVVDIARDGPHALIAGTTGSGKSEFLQTLVASLACANRPDELTFVLVDYKGGAAFGACEALPHTVGVVTDLDGRLVERALASLRAELKRREATLAAAGAPNLEVFRAGGGALARLIIVVDEFASLAEELPDFVGGLVGIAQRGRSLGVHLVLATQRPEGVVNADIRANTNLRICLGVVRESESRDVIDAVDAARIQSGNAWPRLCAHGAWRTPGVPIWPSWRPAQCPGRYRPRRCPTVAVAIAMRAARAPLDRTGDECGGIDGSRHHRRGLLLGSSPARYCGTDVSVVAAIACTDPL